MKIKETDVKNLIVMKKFWKNSKMKQTTHTGKDYISIHENKITEGS